MSLYQGGMEGEKSESPDLLCESASDTPQAEVIRRPGKRALVGARGRSLDVCPSVRLAGRGRSAFPGRYGTSSNL